MRSLFIQEVETAAKHEDRSRAFVFFLFFARFEYALKRAGFVEQSKSGAAMTNWTEYASKRASLLSGTKDERLKGALEYLAKSPPKKQVVTRGQLDWSVDDYNGTHDLARVLTLVRRVRNNLFHGGKFPSGTEHDLSRDRDLINTCLIILEGCLESDEDLKHRFTEGISW